MQLQHIKAKVFVEGEFSVPLDRFIETFHGWIADQAFTEMLIDVADYRHVPHGPGIVLVGLESDYAIDQADGRWGLLYNRKGPLEGSNDDRFAHSLREAARVAGLLEQRLPGLRFSRSEFELAVNDRALCPHTPEGVEGFQAALASFLTGALGQPSYEATYADDVRSLVAARVTLPAPVDLLATPAAKA